MKYDFDSIIDRSGTYSLKWNVSENELPMWVADMDFKVAPEIIDAVVERTNHGIYGYSIVPDEWYQAYIKWWTDRHEFIMEKDWLLFCTGVIPAISSIVRELTTIDEKVLIQTPVYNNFFNAVTLNDRCVSENPLLYCDNKYKIDFADLEKKLSDPKTVLMLLCNPQNPAGVIWKKEELAEIGRLCAKYNVIVVSDEIHCDITDIGTKYIPFASVSEECKNNSITCIAPTKAFNIAGLRSSAVSIPNPSIRKKICSALNASEIAEPNAFAVQAAVAAFTKGGEWLDEFRSYIYENKIIVNDYINKNIPSIKMVPTKSTYLLWLDCSSFCDDSEQLCNEIRKISGLFLSNGVQYGGNGKHFLRMNIACPKSVLNDGLNRLSKAIEIITKGK